MMKRFFLIILVLASSSAYAAQPDFWRNIFVDLEAATNGVYIQPQQFKSQDQPRYINFTVLSSEVSANGKLDIDFILVAGESVPTVTAFKLLRDDKELIAENYVSRSGDKFTLDIPDMTKGEYIQFAIGFENFNLSVLDITALLTTDQQAEKNAHFQGWAIR